MTIREMYIMLFLTFILLFVGGYKILQSENERLSEFPGVIHATK